MILHQYQLSCLFGILRSGKLKYWVKVQFTTSSFQIFITCDTMTICGSNIFWSLESLSNIWTKKLKPIMEEEKNTIFQSIILVSICVAYNLYELVHASWILTMFLFVVWNYVVHLVMHEFVRNEFGFEKLAKMVKRSNLIDVMHIFKDICGLLWAHGAMDDMQIHVEKLKAWVFQSNHIFFQIKRL